MAEQDISKKGKDEMYDECIGSLCAGKHTKIEKGKVYCDMCSQAISSEIRGRKFSDLKGH